MAKISSLYDDEQALSSVQKAAQRAQMRKRAQASAFTGTDTEAILHKLPMKKRGIIGAGKDRIFQLRACVLRYGTSLMSTTSCALCLAISSIYCLNHPAFLYIHVVITQ